MRAIRTTSDAQFRTSFVDRKKVTTRMLPTTPPAAPLTSNNTPDISRTTDVLEDPSTYSTKSPVDKFNNNPNNSVTFDKHSGQYAQSYHHLKDVSYIVFEEDIRLRLDRILQF